ncbi:hypothetical protein [Streptomyces sp. NPDC058279]|uniref:hypothetical protein n=1 Tax=Streptomyces sp. NPDC058279 TaxID=3346418 RepID=UPI0036EE869C
MAADRAAERGATGSDAEAACGTPTDTGGRTTAETPDTEAACGATARAGSGAGTWLRLGNAPAGARPGLGAWDVGTTRSGAEAACGTPTDTGLPNDTDGRSTAETPD